ncbi:MAG: class I SAM-dependent methyltransferase [Proteobacteria bacterium]|nr:class I SAM-dependent methyltransferase [Pseudomonadota bacterium]MBI3499109.1 class I SAM-dependent methyltransferase [Pseudomonadota bacterium]
MREVMDILFPGQPVFPDGIAGKQGYMLRHLWMVTAVILKANLGRPIRVLEIGSWVGFSALTWAEAIRIHVPEKGTILCIDPWERYLPEAEVAKGPHYLGMHQAASLDIAYSVFRHNIAVASGPVRVDHFRGRSREVLPYLTGKQFDIVFIDGAHGYADVTFDIAETKRLVRDDGFICGDDLELQLDEVDPAFAETKKEEDYLNDPKTGRPFHPGVCVAVHEAFGKVSCYTGFWIMQVRGNAYEPVVFQSIKTFIPTHFDAKYKDMIMEELRTMGLTGPASAAPGAPAR